MHETHGMIEIMQIIDRKKGEGYSMLFQVLGI
jgi:hypothetical protein